MKFIVDKNGQWKNTGNSVYEISLTEDEAMAMPIMDTY